MGAISSRAHLARASAIAIAASLAGSGAFAQDTVDEVVVTGTSIRGVAALGSPTTGVSVEQMKESGVATASEAVRLLPSVLNLGADPSRSSFTGGAQDAAANSTAIRSLNLRGIGAEATLVLFNGRRLAPGGVIKSITDPDQIPTSAIARIEVVQDGASAIYGSDAVAGVVNIISRTGFDGAETTLRYGMADDYESRMYSQTFGKVWDKGSVFFAYEHADNSHLSGSKRDFFSQDRRARGGSDQRQFTAVPGNIVIGAVRYPLPNTSGVGLNPAALVPGTANRFDESDYADILPWQDRDTVLFNIHYDVDERLEVWYEGLYSRRKYDLAAPPAAFPTGGIRVPNTNPWFVVPAGVTPTPTTVNVEYRLVEDLNPNSYGFENVQHQAAGFSFDLGWDWQIDGYLAHNMSRGFQARENVLNNAALTAALASSNPATAFNPFGNGTFNRANNAALLEIIDAERDQYGTSITQDFAIKADGPLFDMPGGAVRGAVGAEYHDNSFRQSLFATNVLASGAETTKSVHNTRDVHAVFGELYVPLVGPDNAMPGIQKLDLNFAARWETYSDFGETTNPKVSAVYSPFDGLSFRGTWGTSFRAPSLVDSADQILNYFIQNLTDPTSPTGTRRGVAFNGGNSGLGPEEAETWTLGFDFRPDFLEGFEASVTYYNIEYTDRIDAVPFTAMAQGGVYAPFIRRRPPASDAAATAAFDAMVAQIMASPDLQNPVEPVGAILVVVDGRRHNLGSLKQDGLDVSLGYRFATPVGDWRAGLDLAKIFHVERMTAPGVPEVDVVDTFGNPVDLRVRGSLTWRMDGWSAAAFVNYVDEYRNTAISPNVDVDSYTLVDASVAYEFDEGPRWLEGLRLSASVTNLFDEDPPVVLNGNFSWDNQVANPIGRMFSFEVSKRW